jgi:hypothetical protein
MESAPTELRREAVQGGIVGRSMMGKAQLIRAFGQNAPFALVLAAREGELLRGPSPKRRTTSCPRAVTG